MTAPRTLTRTREDLAEFLRMHREKIAPEEVGLPRGRRRRTPGLRREEVRQRLSPWETQVSQMLSSFRRDFARAAQDPTIDELVEELTKVSPEFKQLWKTQEVNAPCQGVRHLYLEELGEVAFEHTTLTVDEERHLRLVYYAVKEADPQSAAFTRWVRDDKGAR
ncbi:hypothetical protein K7H09_11600 [Halomonas sp. IOP_14]|uniref:MmyB family transcriptional regulator n=1 Tax=Halomonas sp. IOP_14 TaxID=2873295 RepID=UPI001E51B27E|nr:hypothetical protein [Halomonas sp. IOP_14]MCD1586666.1 hypothetical protein [Halomonas sp. IOP_14]